MHKKLLILLGAGAIGAGAWLFATLHNASQQLTTASTEVAREGQIPFHTIRLDRAAPAGFEPISSPAQFTGAAAYNGHIYLCGPTGLLGFDATGKQTSEYHVGPELPPAPLVRMAVGVGATGAGPQLWIATHGEGFLIFNGSSFTQIRPDPAPDRALTSVLPLASGRVLFGTEKSGVLVWDGTGLATLHPALAGLHVTALAGEESDLWIGTVDTGVVRWHAGQSDNLGAQLPDPRVLSIVATPESVYVGTALGVAEFQNGGLTRTLASGIFANALFLRNDSLVIGTLEEGVVEVPLKTAKPRLRNVVETADSPPVEEIVELDGKLFTLAEDGLYEKGRRVFDIAGSRLTDRNISALAPDRTGRLWVGYFDRGLDVLDPSFDRRSHFEDEHLFCVNRISHDPDRGETAVGTANGLVLFDAATRVRQVLTKADGLIANQVSDVLFGRGNMTVATAAGLTMFGAGGTTSLYAFHGLVNNHVYTLASTGDKVLAGTLGGLSMLEAGAVRANFTTANSALKQNWITAIQPIGQEWIVGTYGAGVMKLDSSGRWTAFPEMKGGIEINPNAMAVTGTAVYAGTLGKGLAVYNRSSGRWVFLTAGLPSANVTALAAANGYVYVGTDNGLVRIAEQRVNLP